LPDPVTVFVLTTAAGVLSGLVTDMIRGGKEATMRKEIEYEVSRRLMQRNDLSSGELRRMAREIMDEIKLLALKDPELRISEEAVELVSPVRPKLPFGRQKKVERKLSEHLSQLGKAVASRRRELGLPLDISEAEMMGKTETEITEESVPQGVQDSTASRQGVDCGEENADRLLEETENSVGPRREIATLEWESPDSPPKSSEWPEWSEQIRITRDRVRRRRQGEDLDE